MNRKRSLLQNILLTLAILTVLFFCLFPFIQIISISLKHQFDWGNPSLMPVKFNFDAYKELLGFVESTDGSLPEQSDAVLRWIAIAYVVTPALLHTGSIFILNRYKLATHE